MSIEIEDIDDRVHLLSHRTSAYQEEEEDLVGTDQLASLHAACVAEAELVRLERNYWLVRKLRPCIRWLRRDRMTALANKEDEMCLRSRTRQLADAWLNVRDDFEAHLNREEVRTVLVRGRLLPSHGSMEERLDLIRQLNIPFNNHRAKFLDVLFLVVIKPFASAVDQDQEG